MNHSEHLLTIRFRTLDGQTYHLDLEGSEGGEARGSFVLPYDVATWRAIALALEPFFELAEADAATQAVLQPLGHLDQLPRTVGLALATALLAGEGIRMGFDAALSAAEGRRQPLRVNLHFGAGCDRLAALPWELLYHRGRFLVADTSIALTRYPEGAFPPTPAGAELPLRLLLVLSEPLDASPIFSQRAREELLHGLRTLDEHGAVFVDLLRPPTFDALVEAVTTGGYHLLVFYGHGVYDEASGGQLLFEDEFGAGELVAAEELGRALRNTQVRLVVLGACQSAQVGEGGGVWSGTAPALLRAGVPLAVGMQVSMRVDAALTFFRQFALSLAAGKPVVEAVAEARKPLGRRKYGAAWFIPALYGRPAGDYRLFDPALPLPEGTADLRAQMKERRVEIARLEEAVGRVGVLTRPAEIARLRAARAAFTQLRAELARSTSGGCTPVTSPLYGVPSNPVFVGRSHELREVARELRGDQPVVIWGTGGIGKTALAIEVAHRQSWRFPGGVLWLDCRGDPAWDALLDRIGAFCGLADVDQLSPDEKEPSVRWALSALDGRCLLTWDNAEGVWDNPLVRNFIQDLPSNCQALLTTREDPHMSMWPTIEILPLEDQAMTRLFYSLAIAARVKIGARADLDAIPRIVAHLQGHPLALTVVVPLAKLHGIERTWNDLRLRPPGKVEEAFNLSFERLTLAQQRLFTRLSVFTIPFRWEAAGALVPDVTGADRDLDELVARALINFDGARYSYHALLRQYAYAKLQEAEDPRPIHRLAAEYLQAKITDPERAGTPEEGLEEVDQWEQAEAWPIWVGRVGVLAHNLQRLGYWPDIRQRLLRARAMLQTRMDSSPRLEARILRNLGIVAHASGNWQEAITYHQEASDLCRVTGDQSALASNFGYLGAIYADRGDWEQAIHYYTDALDLMDQPQKTISTAITLLKLAEVFTQTGQWDQAVDHVERAQGILRDLGAANELATSYAQLGLIFAYRGDFDQAISMFRMVHEEDVRTGDLRGLVNTLSNAAMAYAARGDLQRAIRICEYGLGICRRLGDIHTAANILGTLGSILLNEGQVDCAIECWEDALKIFERLGAHLGIAKTYGNLAKAYLAKGEPDESIRLAELALPMFERLSDVQGVAKVHCTLGAAYVRRGEVERGMSLLRKSLSECEALGDRFSMGEAYQFIGFSYAVQGNVVAAAHYISLAYFVLLECGAQPLAGIMRCRLASLLGSLEAADMYLSQAERQVSTSETSE
jgi:tetratricopeptide (TPR) repeat protein